MRRIRTRERSRVAHHIRDANVVKQTDVRRVRRTCVMLLRTEDQKRVAVRVRCVASVAITDIARRTGSAGVELPIDEDAHLPAACAARHRDMPPLPVRHSRAAVDGMTRRPLPYTKADPPRCQRNAVIAVVAAAVHITVDDRPSGDPPVAGGAWRAGSAACGRLHPELDGEIAADIGRHGRIDPHLDPVDIACAVAIELERIAARRLRLRLAQPGVGEQRKKPARRNKKDKRN